MRNINGTTTTIIMLLQKGFHSNVAGLAECQWAHWHPPIFGLFFYYWQPQIFRQSAVPIISNLKKLGLNADLILVVKFLVLLGRMMFHHKFRISFSSIFWVTFDRKYWFLLLILLICLSTHLHIYLTRKINKKINLNRWLRNSELLQWLS